MDPANTRARSRFKRGLGRELEQDRILNPPHPAKGGTRGYPTWQRRMALHVLYTHLDYEMAAASIDCSVISVRRWEQRAIPYRMSGGVPKSSIIASDQLILSICLYIYPDASSDELCIFIIANGGGVYTQQILSRRCQELGLTRKHSSREAYNTFLPSSIRKAL